MKLDAMKKNPHSVRSVLPTCAMTTLLAGCMFCVFVLLAGCGEAPDPRTAPITASTPEEFTAWKNAAAKKIPAADMQEFDSCVNEIGMRIMQRKEASGQERVANKVCEYVNGKTFREVLVLGYSAVAEWVPKEIAYQGNNIRAAEEALKTSTNEEKNTQRRDYLVTAKDVVAKLGVRLEKAKARLAELENGAQKKE